MKEEYSKCLLVVKASTYEFQFPYFSRKILQRQEALYGVANFSSVSAITASVVLRLCKSLSI